MSNTSGSKAIYFLDLSVWARFVIAIAAFILSETLVEKALRLKLIQLKPLLAPSARPAAAAAVVTALRRRDSGLAEAVCLLIAVIATLFTLWNLSNVAQSAWAVNTQDGARSLLPAGWWCLLVSSPMLYFLFLRGLWRHLVWAMLLGQLARPEMKLAVSHPDKNAGLGFMGDYPNAYTLFVFGVSCIPGAAVAYHINDSGLSLQAYSAIMAAWLVLVLIVVASPLLVFRAPLAKLKRSTLAQTGTQATHYFRRSEDKILGSASSEDTPPDPADSLADPTKIYDAAKKLSVLLLNRSAIIPVCTAALLPLVAGSATLFPYKEIWSEAKKLLLL